jgi:hypothetical protein
MLQSSAVDFFSAPAPTLEIQISMQKLGREASRIR